MYIIGARADVSRDQALSDSDSDESDDDDDMQGTEQGDEVRQITCSWLQGTLCTSISLFYIHTYIDNDSPDWFFGCFTCAPDSFEVVYWSTWHRS